MKPSKSSGLDGISIASIQKLFYGVGQPLLDVVNASLVSGQVPKAWKHALVTPIPKGKVVAEPADTRPISILPAITKIVERVVQRQLSQYLEQNHLFFGRTTRLQKTIFYGNCSPCHDGCCSPRYGQR